MYISKDYEISKGKIRKPSKWASTKMKKKENHPKVATGWGSGGKYGKKRELE